MLRISGGSVRLHTGTLYAVLDRLREAGLIEVDREEIVNSPAAPVLPADRGGRGPAGFARARPARGLALAGQLAEEVQLGPEVPGHA